MSRLRARTRFVGHLDQKDLAALLASADVAVIPSLYEPFGLAALEAMAVGVPVVASATGGLLDLVVPGSGLLVDPGDHAALSRAVHRVLDDPTMANSLRHGGRERASELSWETAASAVRDVYRSCYVRTSD